MDDKIREVIALYKSITGREIIPQGTNPQRTYQYRYAAKFVDNMKHVPWDTAKKIAYYAIEYARANKEKNSTIWTRGLWILTKSNIIDIAYDSAKKHEEKINNDLEKIIESLKFVQSKGGLLDVMVEGGFPNIVAWYENNSISMTYLAMSESCKQAMKSLSESDRKMLPGQDDIIRRRVRCLIDDVYNKKVKSVLGKDYIKIS